MEEQERRLIIIGDGPTRQEDFALASHTTNQYDIMIINKVIDYGYNYDHWVSLHPNIFLKRTAWSGLTHSNHSEMFRPDCIWKYENKGGTSAKFAVYIAERLKYNKVALVGCPLSSHYGYSSVLYEWKKSVISGSGWYRNSIRSFSGKTLELLGDARGWW